MKGFLFLLVVILSGALVWTWYGGKSVGGRGGNEVAELEDKLLAARAEQDRLRKDLESFKSRLRKYEPVEEAGEPAPVAASAASPVVPAGSLDEKLQQLQAIYQRSQQSLRDETRQADIELADAETAYKRLEKSPPQFMEHSVQTTMNSDGSSSSSNRGTRTSQADRDRAMAKYNEELSGLRAKVTDARKRIQDIETRNALLDQQYRQAVDKAKAEFPGSR